MPNKTNKNIYWVIKEPEGDIFLISKTRKGAIGLLTTWTIPYKWQHSYQKGYRCVRVKITEVE